nr:hypothetical protein OG781_11190 [Streptomyces sp. NBC_00830]
MSDSIDRPPVRMCVECEHITETPVAVRVIHANSGPGWNVYACPDCAPSYLTLDHAWGLYIEHVAGCRDCTREACCVMGAALVHIHRRSQNKDRVARRPRA